MADDGGPVDLSVDPEAPAAAPDVTDQNQDDGSGDPAAPAATAPTTSEPTIDAGYPPAPSTLGIDYGNASGNYDYQSDPYGFNDQFNSYYSQNPGINPFLGGFDQGSGQAAGQDVQGYQSFGDWGNNIDAGGGGPTPYTPSSPYSLQNTSGHNWEFSDGYSATDNAPPQLDERPPAMYQPEDTPLPLMPNS